MNFDEAVEYIKHKGQKRIGGDDYANHPISVANILKELGFPLEYQIAGLFHDLLEDTDAAPEEITAHGSVLITEAVILLTKEAGYDMKQYIERIKGNDIALNVKLADRMHNLICAVYADNAFKRKYIEETEKYYFDLAAGTVFEGAIRRAVTELYEGMK